MKKQPLFVGSAVAICTPFHKDAIDYEKLEELLNVLLPKKALHEYGVREEELETFTDSVMTEQGRLMANNFVPLSREQVLEIYRKLY